MICSNKEIERLLYYGIGMGYKYMIEVNCGLEPGVIEIIYTNSSSDVYKVKKYYEDYAWSKYWMISVKVHGLEEKREKLNNKYKGIIGFIKSDIELETDKSNDLKIKELSIVSYLNSKNSH